MINEDALDMDDRLDEEEEVVRCSKCGKTGTMCQNCGSGTWLCEDCDPPCSCCYDVNDELDEDEEEEMYPAKYEEQVKALEAFLTGLLDVKPPYVVNVYAFDCEYVGGFRIAEISIHSDRGGCAYQRSDPDTFCLALILACEDYVRDFNVKPFRPEGWESDIDAFADAKWTLEQIIKDRSPPEPEDCMTATLTPRQERRARIDARSKQIAEELGITDWSNFRRTSDWKALETLATENATIEQLVCAVHWLDQDSHTDLSNYSHAAAYTDRVRLAAAPDSAIRRAVRFEGEALEAMLEASPRTVVRRLLLQRLVEAGVRLPNDHLNVCRWLYDAFQSRKCILPHLRRRPDLQEYVERANATLAEYGVTV